MKLYFDENISKYYAQAFNALETTENPRLEVLSTVDVWGEEIEDPDLITNISKEEGRIVTKDSDFKLIRLYAPLVKQMKIGAFWLHTPSKLNKWIEIEFIIKAWPEIRQYALKTKPPFLFEVTMRGKMKELPLG